MRGTAARKTRGPLTFARRAFLVSLIAICAALSVSFTAASLAVRTEIQAAIKDSLERSQQSIELARSGQNLRSALVLQMVSADSSLSRALLEARRPQAARIIREHLEAARNTLGSDWVSVRDSRGALVAAVPAASPVVPVLAASPAPPASGIQNIGGTLYDMGSTPIVQQRRVIATLTVAKRFDFAGIEKLGPAGLLLHGQLVRSSFPPSMAAQIAGQIKPDCARAGCALHIGSEDFVVVPVSSAAAGASLPDEYQLLSFRSVDATMNEVRHRFRMLFPAIAVCTVLLAICISVLASRAVSQPIRQLTSRLESSETFGRLRFDFPEESPTREINQLAAALNAAALAAAQSRERLDRAGVQFVETMAQALDARDPYTAGHSIRVRDYAVAIAAAMHLAPEEIEVIRVGAQLHDIGKIGIPDVLLQKTGALTPEEYELIKMHPEIGKRILGRVGHFDKYLPFVHLHHEDYNGGGYPKGLKGDQVPLGVRIVHVADVYDALTSNRAYRDAMPAATAQEMLELCSGAQFDPNVVRVFSAILNAQPPAATSEIERLAGLART
jgi:HD-GYP domain-containing protein (c-di-GMP phosphodiesterase class II)